MNEQPPDNKVPKTSQVTRRTIRHSLKVVFFCMTALPLLVFAFVYFQIGTFNTALAGALIALALILMLEGFIVFRKMADHIERLSATMAEAEEGKAERVYDSGETKELALIADSFNRTLSKLENTAREMSIKTAQASTLYEIKEVLSKTIRMEDVAGITLEKAIGAVNARAGYLAVKQDQASVLRIVAISGVPHKTPEQIDSDPERTLAGRVLGRRGTLLIEDIEMDSVLKPLNRPDIGLPRLLYLPVVAKDAPIGTLALGKQREDPPFEEGDVRFLQTLLHQIAYSFENARLYHDLQQSKKEVERALYSQKKSQAQLLASSRMAAFGELSVNIAHELNNPLTGIIGYADLLLQSQAKDEEARMHLEKIQEQALRAGSIIKGLLDFANTGSGSRITADVNELVSKALLMSKGRLSDHGIELSLHTAEGLSLVMADPPLMEQVFFSLVSNAINAMTGRYEDSSGGNAENATGGKEGLLLQIKTSEKMGKVYVTFKDTGPGMAPEVIQRIFEPFYSTQERVNQVGLGLWISQRTVKAHGGRIQVRSVLGKGSLFAVVLPAAGNLS